MIEITNKLRKFVASLDQVKVRREYRLFVAEGSKCVLDTLGYFKLKYFFATAEWADKHKAYLKDVEAITAKRQDLITMSHLSTPPDVLAVYEIPDAETDMSEMENNLTLCLDGVQDPGNLGTIMRIADWFGIRQIICSKNSVDVYNPKVVQATMGAISRVSVIYTDLPELIRGIKDRIPVAGTFLHGENLYDTSLPANGLIVLGNEGNGISDEVGHLVSKRLTIPSYPGDAATSESLNVGMAAAITVSEYRRRMSAK